MGLLNDNQANCEQISINEGSQAIKHIKIDISLGPDHIFMQSLKIKECR